MALSQMAKGKKRAFDQREDYKGKNKEQNQTEPEPVTLRIKKPKRAETRPCPVCDEQIPLRLMSLHSQLESERVESIIRQIGSSEPILLAEEVVDDNGAGPSSRSRRSAVKALKSFTTSFPSSSSFKTTEDLLTKTILTIQRHRKQRLAKFKEMAKEEEEGYSYERRRWAQRTNSNSNSHSNSTNINGDDEIICPVCSKGIRGDLEIIDAHVDSCLYDESRRMEEERIRRTMQEEEDWIGTPVGDGLRDGTVGHVGNVRGTGFHTRDPTSQDVEDEIDIDGEDQAYGEAQFTEGDILPVNNDNPPFETNEEVEIDDEGDRMDGNGAAQMSLRDLIAEGKVIQRWTPEVEVDAGESGSVDAIKSKVDQVLGLGDADKMELGILRAKRKGDKEGLIFALEEKIQQLESIRVSSSTSLLCRICLDPYNEPTVSTGCWHTCCRECWLRCLGSTKLCPICKRITGAIDLRRIYL